MKTANASTLLDRILVKLRPADLHISERRLALKAHVEYLVIETGLSRREFGARVRSEISDLRAWLSGTRDLTVEHLSEFCGSLHISLGDLLLE